MSWLLLNNGLATWELSKGFAATLKSISKTDRNDAMMLARYRQSLQPVPTELEEEPLHQLRQQHKHLNNLRISYQAIANQLHALSFDPRASLEVKQSLNAILATLQVQIDQFEQDIDVISQQDLQPIIERMLRVVGIGPATAIALGIATNGLHNSSSAKAVAKYIGIAPSQTQSGSSVHRRGRMARTGLGYIRGLLYMAARSARQYNLSCKSLYERLKARGRCHKVGIVTVAMQ